MNEGFSQKPIMILFGFLITTGCGLYVIFSTLDHRKTIDIGVETTGKIVQKYSKFSSGRHSFRHYYVRYKFQSPNIYTQQDPQGNYSLRTVENEEKVSGKFYRSISKGNSVVVYYRFDDFELKSGIDTSKVSKTINLLMGMFLLFPFLFLCIVYIGAILQTGAGRKQSKSI